MSNISLKSLLVPSKAVSSEYPGMPGFVVELAYLSREALMNMRKKATKTTFKNRKLDEDLDEKLFLKLYCDAAIKGWKGLKLSYVEQLAPVDLSNANPDDELDYTPEDALSLMQSSADFDAFISETVTQLANFPNSNMSKSTKI